MKHAHGRGYAVVPPGRMGECRGRIAGHIHIIIPSQDYIINMPFTCLLEEGYLISYSARREGLDPH